MNSQVPIPDELLSILACPACEERPALKATEDGKGLRCTSCGRVYPITDSGIPQLLEDAAEPFAAEPEDG